MTSIRWFRGVVLSVAGVAALMTFGCSTTGPDRAAQTAANLREIRAEVATIETQTDAAVAALNELVAAQGDVKPQFDAYTKAVQTLEQSAKTVGQRADAIQTRGDEYFAAWEKDSEAIANPEIRQHSADRRAKLQESYQAISVKYNETKEAFTPLRQKLADIQKVVALDLTPAGLAPVKDLAKQATKDAEAVRAKSKELSAELEKVAGLLASAPAPAPEPSE